MVFANITNDSVINQLAHHFAPLVPNVFGVDSAGTSIFFGLVIILLFLGVCMYLRLSLDAVLAIMFPLIILLSMYKFLPMALGFLAVVVGVGIVAMAVITWRRR
jgi:ABC-type cobalamin transport system permease subunit